MTITIPKPLVNFFVIVGWLTVVLIVLTDLWQSNADEKILMTIIVGAATVQAAVGLAVWNRESNEPDGTHRGNRYEHPNDG